MSFENTAVTACVLTGYPTVVASEPGQPDVVATDGGFFPDPGPEANIAPGESAHLNVMTERDCPERDATPGTFPSAVYHRLSIRLPGGEATLAAGVDVLCGLSVSRFGVPQPEPPTIPDPRSNLTATLELPANVKAGATLHYVVALTNPTDHDIPLDYCPGYVEHSDELNSKERYALNCDTTPVITAHATIRFAMQLQVPATATPGTNAKIFWELIAVSNSATGTITIAPE